MNLNKAFILGNLTRDPELRQIPSGQAVCSFGVATNRFFTDSLGQKQKQVEFHNIVAWGRQAEVINQYLKKGSSVLVEGRLQTRSWQNQQGQKQWKTEIIAERVELGPKPTFENNQPAGRSGFNQNNNFDRNIENDNEAPRAPEPQRDETPIIELPDENEEEINVKDIPF